MRRLLLLVTHVGCLAAFALLAASAGAKDGRELLERYRPLLQYDSAEEYFAQPVSLPPQSAAVRAGDRVYGHFATEGDDRWLQYWLYYAYNPQDRSPLKTGRHEGDWELIQYRIGPDDRPDLATMSQHSWAEGCTWSELQHDRDREDAAVLYVANGSHANYSRAGGHGRPFPDPTDEAGGEGRRVRPAVTPITERRPAWVRYQGTWGESEAGFVPGEQSSPVGPRFQDSDAWNRPSSYHESVARPCGLGAPGRPWQTALMIAAALAALLGAAVVTHRRR